MSQIQKSPVDSFTLASRGRAFFRGLLSGQPLLEIARAGVMANLSDEVHTVYTERLSARAPPEMILELLNSGSLSDKSQVILASVLAEKGTEEMAFHVLIRRDVTSDAAESILAAKIVSGMFAYILLRGCCIKSHAAQDVLAYALKQSGLYERAADILLHDSVASDTARMHLAASIPPDRRLITKLIIFGSMPDDVRRQLSTKLPPSFTPIYSSSL